MGRGVFGCSHGAKCVDHAVKIFRNHCVSSPKNEAIERMSQGGLLEAIAAMCLSASSRAILICS